MMSEGSEGAMAASRSRTAEDGTPSPAARKSGQLV
ncbi:hypothetical protein SMICM17S_09129 [Streptomyces microflavus]